MHALPPTSFNCYTAYIGSWWNHFDWKPTKTILRFMPCDRQNRRGSVKSNKHETFSMNEINNSVFWEGIGWRVLVFQDGNYALTMDSASLSTCQMVVMFGNYHRFKTNFLLPLKWQNFWHLHIRKFHSFVILDVGDRKWQVQRWRSGKLKRFLVRIPGQNFTCIGLARNHNTYMYTPVMPKDCDKLCLKLTGNK